MIVEAVKLDVTQYTVQYELLRATLTPRAVDAPDPAPHEGSLPSSATAVCCLASVRHEVTTLLANLVLSTRSAVHQSSREGYRSW